MMIGVDIGTTNVKAVAVSDAGEACAAAERRNETMAPQAGWSEQAPDVVFQNVLSVLREVMQDKNVVQHSETVQGIVFSSAMHGLVAVNANGEPLGNFWLWSDLRADDVAHELRGPDGQGADLYKRTGVPIHPMSPLCKLIWMRRQLPDVFQKAHKFLGIKEYVWYQLTGKFESDISCASATGLMNVWKNEWDDGALDLAGITTERLPALVAPGHQAQFSESLKLSEISGIKPPCLIIGASDGALANLGAGATEPGQLCVTIGTSAAIRCVTPGPATDGAMRTFCYRLDEKRCIVGGGSNNGTNALEWLRTVVFCSPESTEDFINQAVDIAPGAAGLSFLPYLQGERAPLWNAQARGAFQGLTIQHTQAHFVRAVLEGILFNLKIIAGGMRAQGPIRSLFASGGFAQNTLWVQMLADIFQTPVVISESGFDASVLGAVQLGRTELGLMQIDDSQQEKTLQPDPEKAAAYQEAFLRFQGYL